MEVLAGVDWLQLALVWLVIAVAAVTRAFTGFGFALVAVPGLALIVAPTEALVTCAALAFALGLFTLRTYWRRFPMTALAPMILMSMFGTAAGAMLVRGISPALFSLWIGIVVMLACVVLTLYKPGRHGGGTVSSGLTGASSGLLNGAFAIPGPPVIVYALATEPDPVRSRALMMTFFLFSSVIALASYGVAGFFTRDTPVLFLAALPAMYLGDKLGYRLFRDHGAKRYRPVALITLFAVGAATTLSALSIA